jgi:predicted ATPase
MSHLRSIELRSSAHESAVFPFNLPVFQSFEPVAFDAPVTFLVGENGSGKSTFLEAVAIAVGSVVVGGEDLAHDPSLDHVRGLADALKLTWNKRTHRGFFLRAEDFFRFARRTHALQEELQETADAFGDELSGYGLELARGAVLGEKAALDAQYDGDIDARSHGESFLQLFEARFAPGGLYLLDEPEAPLSPQRQLALLRMLHEKLAQDAQFIIATHSPILMAYPGAAIYSFDSAPARRVSYDELEHVTLTRDFLNNRDTFLRKLFSDDS